MHMFMECNVNGGVVLATANRGWMLLNGLHPFTPMASRGDREEGRKSHYHQ